MARNIKVDFYQVEVSPGGRTFKTILEDTGALPHDGRVWKAIDQAPIRLDEFNSNDREITGDIVKIRMDALPPKETLAGKRTTIEFEDDEGLGEATAFLYIPDLNVLIFQYNHTGVRSSSFCRYLTEMSKLNGGISLLPILRKDAFDAMKKMPVVKELLVDVAKVKQLHTVVHNSEHDIEEGIDIIKAFEAPSVKLSIGMGKQRGSLPSVIKEVAKMLFKRAAPDDQSIVKLRINGRDEAGDFRVIDLLKYRMETIVEVAIPPGERRMLYPDKCDALRRAFNTYKSEIRELYKNP